MMKYMSDVLDGVHGMLGVNAATLSGAVDIVVVRSASGDLECTPFHVRFGKMQIIRAAGTDVSISVNGALAPLKMKLGAAGEAYFCGPEDEADLTQSVPATLDLEQDLVRNMDVRKSPGGDASVFIQKLEHAKADPKHLLSEAPILRSISAGNVDASRVPGEDTEWKWGKLPRVASRDLLLTAADDNKWEHLGRSLSEESEGIEISLCASLLQHSNQTQGAEIFEANKVSFEHFTREPMLMFSDELVVRMGEQLLPFAVAGPFLFSFLFFKRRLDPAVLQSLEEAHPLLKPSASEAQEDDDESDVQPKSSGWKSWIWRSKSPAPLEDDEADDDEEMSMNLTNTISEERPLCPTSDQLKLLNLQDGCNEVVFSVNTGLRGVQTLSCHLFLWEADVPIVVSDVDGTITISDVPGQFLPYVGRDWSHGGVATLFSRIKENGYNILYLTARSIGQAHSTRGFITGLQQEGSSLPLGPIFMSPDRLLYSLSREVIERRPEEFKIRCLQSLKSCYPVHFNPFTAGFGNRHSDWNSYLAVGIEEARIFIINPTGTVSTHNITYNKTYTDLALMCNEMFPKRDHSVPLNFSGFSFWKSDHSAFEDEIP